MDDEIGVVRNDVYLRSRKHILLGMKSINACYIIRIAYLACLCPRNRSRRIRQ